MFGLPFHVLRATRAPGFAGRTTFKFLSVALYHFWVCLPPPNLVLRSAYPTFSEGLRHFALFDAMGFSHYPSGSPSTCCCGTSDYFQSLPPSLFYHRLNLVNTPMHQVIAI